MHALWYPPIQIGEALPHLGDFWVWSRRGFAADHNRAIFQYVASQPFMLNRIFENLVDDDPDRFDGALFVFLRLLIQKVLDIDRSDRVQPFRAKMRNDMEARNHLVSVEEPPAIVRFLLRWRLSQ